jgi:hypothetical protein
MLLFLGSRLESFVMVICDVDGFVVDDFCFVTDVVDGFGL